MKAASYVWIWLEGQSQPVVCGRISWDGARAQFAYVRSYPALPGAISLHPDWRLNEPFGQRHGPAEDDALPPVFIDVAPGAWGEYALRKILGKSLTAYEYLTFPSADRVGALEFTDRPNAPPKPPDPLPEAEIKKLRKVIEALDTDKELPDELRLVWKHGTSVGGRWPKASVVDQKGNHWLLKFGSRLLRKEQQPRFEALGMGLARACRIEVPEIQLEQHKRQPILWVKRFDRAPGGIRRHMISLRSFAELSERTALNRASYPAIGAALRRLSADPAAAVQWFDRMILNIAIGNTDDHALNHLFFWNGRHLSLAPAFDVEPQVENPFQHSMRVGPEGFAGTFQNALAGCGEFGLTKDEAEPRIEKIVRTVAAHWRAMAADCGLDAAQVKDLRQSAILLKGTGAASYVTS